MCIRGVRCGGVIEVKPGVVCLECEYDHIWRILVDLRKRMPELNRTGGYFVELVGEFLAVPFVDNKTVDAGRYHTCAVSANNELVMFGRIYKQARWQARNCDCVCANLGQVAAVSAGWNHTCVISLDGELLVSFELNPSANLVAVKSIACAASHVCVIKDTGELQECVVYVWLTSCFFQLCEVWWEHAVAFKNNILYTYVYVDVHRCRCGPHQIISECRRGGLLLLRFWRHLGDMHVHAPASRCAGVHANTLAVDSYCAFIRDEKNN